MHLYALKLKTYIAAKQELITESMSVYHNDKQKYTKI